MLFSYLRRTYVHSGPDSNGLRLSGGRNSRCSLCINKIGLVNMPGEYNTRIDDDIRVTNLLNNVQNRQHLVVSVREESYYRLRVQLDCGGQLDRDSLDSPCSRSLSVFVWIDYNDNELDDRESIKLRRAWSENSAPTGAYETDIRIPTINGRDVRSGRHRMRVSVIPSEEYQRECGAFSYSELIDYAVNIFPKPAPISKMQYHNSYFSSILMLILYFLHFSHHHNTVPKSYLFVTVPKNPARPDGRREGHRDSWWYTKE